MPDLELIKTLSPLGVGGLLAVVIFVFYRLALAAVVLLLWFVRG